MVISKNSQLGLMISDPFVHKEFIECMLGRLNYFIDSLNNAEEVKTEHGQTTVNIKFECDDDSYTEQLSNAFMSTGFHDTLLTYKDIQYSDVLKSSETKTFLICDGVDKCSKMIRVGDSFSSKALSNVRFGSYRYLMGKNEMCLFVCGAGFIKGWYWDRHNGIVCEFLFDLISGKYSFDPKYPKQFIRIAKILTFVELGDIEVVLLEKGRNNGKAKSEGKITNTSEFNVYVVDSSWNKLIIRTEGFAVMGHFRLQPCGAGLSERKLIWINAFEKHGYKRSPRAKIIHD